MIVKTSYSFNYDSKNNKILLLVWFLFSFFYVITEHFSPHTGPCVFTVQKYTSVSPRRFCILRHSEHRKRSQGKKSAKSTFNKMSLQQISFNFFLTVNAALKIPAFCFFSFVRGKERWGSGVTLLCRPSLCKRDQSLSREKPGNKQTKINHKKGHTC